MRALAFAGILAVVITTPVGADVRLTIQDGRVSLTATDATLRQILDEWARVGQTRIVNIEQVAGAPLTIELANEPEDLALAVILRSVSGYVAAPRPTAIAGASRFDRILIMPTSAPQRPAPTARAGAPPFNPPQIDPPGEGQVFEEFAEEEPEEIDGPLQDAARPPRRGPAFRSFPQAQSPRAPAAAPTPNTPPRGAFPSAEQSTAQPTVGVPTPGMVVPSPQTDRPGNQPLPDQ